MRLEEGLRKRGQVEGQELAQARERLERLERQRDELQSREEHMDLQLKQYMSDFQEERQAREKMAEVKRLLEGLLADKDQQITEFVVASDASLYVHRTLV